MAEKEEKERKGVPGAGNPVSPQQQRQTSADRARTTGFVRKRQMTEEFAVLHDMAKALTSSLELGHLLQTIMEKVEQLLSPDTWSLLLVDEETHELSFQIVKGKSSEKLKGAKLQMNQGIAGWVAMNGQAVIVPDVSVDPRFCGDIDEITHQRTHSIVCVPVQFQDRVLGVVEIVNYKGHRDFDELDVSTLEAMADYVAIALQNAIFVKKIQELTITDDLTGLYNSRKFHEILEQEITRAKRYAFQFSVAFIDLDYFKRVNDTHGHLVGSRLLHEVGQVVRACLRDSDFAFRYGGDEFVVLLPHTDAAGAMELGQRFRQALGSTVFLQEEGLDITITASVGVASFPGDADAKEDLVRLADEAMYQVKNTTRNAVGLAGRLKPT